MAITWVDFSPDCTRVASASIDKKVVLWEVESGTEVLSLTGHTGPVYCICFAKSAGNLYTASYDKTLKVLRALRILCCLDVTHSTVCCSALGCGRQRRPKCGRQSQVRDGQESRSRRECGRA